MIRRKENSFLPEANSLAAEWAGIAETDGDSSVSSRVENIKDCLSSLKCSVSRLIDRAKVKNFLSIDSITKSCSF